MNQLKLQIPNPKHQRNPKSQISNRATSIRLVLGAWNFGLAKAFGVGAWDLGFGICVAVALIFGALPLSAAPNEQKQIQELYRRGLQGNKEAVIQCIDRLETILKTEPGNQLGRVYLGSAFTLRSRDLGFGPKKLQALRHGLALMDEAVAAAPDSAKVRLARALTTSALPAIFGRAASSRRDFNVLAEMAKRSPEQFEAGDLQLVYYNAGLAAKAVGDRSRAVGLWQEGLRHEGDPAITRKLEAEIAKARL